MKKIRKILLIGIIITFVFSNISLGLTNQQKEDQKKAKEIIDFYKDQDNWIVKNGIFEGYKNKTIEDIEKDIEFLNKTNEFTVNDYRAGVNGLKYQITSTISTLNSFLTSQQQKENDKQERENNDKDSNKQENLKNYTVEQMVDYYENHNNSLAALPKTGNVRETWLATLKNTDEYKKYMNSGSQRDKAFEWYKTGQKYSLMVASIEGQQKQENNESERETNNKDTKKQEELKNYTIEQMVKYYEDHNNSLASLPDNGNVRETWISKLKNTDEYKKYIKSGSQRDKSFDWYKTGEEYYQMIASIDTSKNDKRAKDKTAEDKEEESTVIYQYPDKVAGSTAGSLDDMIGDADKFVDSTDGTAISASSLQDFSKTFYNIFLTIGIIVATLVGSILGIKFMLGGAEEKAHIKELLVPYIVGCIVIFGAFAIWKIVVTILSSM